ncbi:hypothetical protein N9013_03125 [Akkermansiaceae bacterium]|jgi:hypothetical protein|nr:hypothetical protein [Akkermansiaceae bacterium]
MEKVKNESVSILELNNSSKKADVPPPGHEQVARYLARMIRKGVGKNTCSKIECEEFISNLPDDKFRDSIWAYISEMRNSQFDGERKRWRDWIHSSTAARSKMMDLARTEALDLLLS